MPVSFSLLTNVKVFGLSLLWKPGWEAQAIVAVTLVHHLRIADTSRQDLRKGGGTRESVAAADREPRVRRLS